VGIAIGQIEIKIIIALPQFSLYPNAVPKFGLYPMQCVNKCNNKSKFKQINK
jgi:hypothetical protein